METAILTSAITGFFSLATALSAVWLKHYLDHRQTVSAVGKQSLKTRQQREIQGAPGWSFLRPLLIFLGGFFIGVVSRIIRPMFHGPANYEALLSIILLVAICLALALNHRRSKRGLWLYQLEAFALWAAFTSGWSVVHGHIWSDLLVGTISWWLGCALVGGILVSIARRKSQAT